MTRRSLVAAGTAALVLVLGTAVAPLPVVLGAGRLLVAVVLVVGAWATVGRGRVPDLGAGLAVALGAVVGGVLPVTLGLPSALGPVAAGLAGAAAGLLGTSLLVRLGALRGSLATLTLTAAAPALAAAWPGVGGAAGFHAVPLLTGSDRGDLVTVGLVAALAVAATVTVAGSRRGAAAVVALAAPHVTRASGRSAPATAAVLGLAGGATLGLAGWASAVLGGSVLPAAFGLPLAGLAVLGAALAGPARWAPPAAGLLLAGPGVLWPLAPLVGDAPPLLTTGVLALGVLAVRGPLSRPRPVAPGAGALPTPAPVEGLRLEVVGATLRGGARVDLHAAPGEVVQLRGPNGAGKSTLLAMIGGQLPDDGTVQLDGRPAPRGPVARARIGVRRTWQRPPEVAAVDLLTAAGVAVTPGDVGRAQLAVALADSPRLLLLDEPSAFLPRDELERLLASTSAAGVTVVVVEHEELRGVDRVEVLEVAP